MQKTKRDINEDGRRRSIYEEITESNRISIRNYSRICCGRIRALFGCSSVNFIGRRNNFRIPERNERLSGLYYARKEDDGWKAYG